MKARCYENLQPIDIHESLLIRRAETKRKMARRSASCQRKIVTEKLKNS